ncbi:MAG TPA: serine hydrolase [Candidatus Limnocylindria bacterium]
MRRFGTIAALVVVTAGLAMGCGRSATPAASGGSASPGVALQWPTEDWDTAAPETEGLDSRTLASGLEELLAHGSQIHSLLIARHGILVMDAYRYPYDGSIYHDLASVTKSVTTTLVGIAADQGLIDLDAPMLSFFPDRDIANRTPEKERITVRQLLSNTSGLDCRVTTQEVTLERMMASDDFVQFALDLDIAAEPGTTFAYCSPGMHLLSAILTQATGLSALEYARANLFAPLGITEVYWAADSDGHSHGWGGLALHPRDAAKIGLLFLRQGRWEDVQLVSADWVEAATARQADTHGFKAEDYGYGWWVSRPESQDIEFFRADGNGGQRIVVVPELDLVVVTTGGGFSLEEATPFILAAATDDWRPLPSDPDAAMALDAAIGALGAGPPGEPVADLPPAAASISGRTIRFEDDLVRSLAIHFTPHAPQATWTLDLATEAGVREMVIGLDGRWRASTGGRPILARGSWTDATTFEAQIDEGPGIASYTLRLVVDERAVRLEVIGVADEVISTTGRLD